MPDGRHRKDIHPGLAVAIVPKQDQRTGRLTRGIVRDVLTKSAFHPHGIKVRLEDGPYAPKTCAGTAWPSRANSSPP
jgi:uncharacterized repeat protein (TIGR03833 family)